MHRIGIVILAAGDSSRLGQPKQLLKIGSSNLLGHSIDAAVGAAAQHIILVLGASFNLIIPQLKKSPAVIVRNTNWQEGMASSIRMGLQTYLDIEPEADAVILMVCDQPFISSTVLQNLADAAAESSMGIIASEYRNLPGTPVLFRRKYFEDLLNLQGERGAKQLFGQYSADMRTVPFEMGRFDIDTRNDYEQFEGRTEQERT